MSTSGWMPFGCDDDDDEHKTDECDSESHPLDGATSAPKPHSIRKVKVFRVFLLFHTYLQIYVHLFPPCRSAYRQLHEILITKFLRDGKNCITLHPKGVSRMQLRKSKCYLKLKNALNCCEHWLNCQLRM